MIAMLSDTSLLIIALVVVLLFGGSQLPKLARNVGTAGKEFRKAQAEADAEAATKATTEGATVVAAVPPAIPVVAPPVDDRITLSKSELNALLDEREARGSAS